MGFASIPGEHVDDARALTHACSMRRDHAQRRSIEFERLGLAPGSEAAAANATNRRGQQNGKPSNQNLWS